MSRHAEMDAIRRYLMVLKKILNMVQE